MTFSKWVVWTVGAVLVLLVLGLAFAGITVKQKSENLASVRSELVDSQTEATVANEALRQAEMDLESANSDLEYVKGLQAEAVQQAANGAECIQLLAQAGIDWAKYNSYDEAAGNTMVSVCKTFNAWAGSVDIAGGY